MYETSYIFRRQPDLCASGVLCRITFVRKAIRTKQILEIQ
jgi:hypothetical protein